MGELHTILSVILGSALVSAIVSAALNFVFEGLNRRRVEARQRSYYSLIAALTLEAYALECAETVASNEFHDQTGGGAGTSRLRLPSWPTYPASIDWQLLSPVLAARALSLPMDILIADRAVEFWWEIDNDPGLLRNVTNEETGKVGNRAWLLAVDLRAAHGLPPLQVQNAWFIQTLADAAAKAAQRAEVAATAYK